MLQSSHGNILLTGWVQLVFFIGLCGDAGQLASKLFHGLKSLERVFFHRLKDKLF